MPACVPQEMRERAAAYGVAPGHWDVLADGEHAFIAHGTVCCGEQPCLEIAFVLSPHTGV